MGSPKGGWWAIRRGSFFFAVLVEDTPSVIPGSRVWWAIDNPTYCGMASADPRPVPVADLPRVLDLPAAPITERHWVLLSGVPEPWALVSDGKPVRLGEVREGAAPWLPSATARRNVVKSVASGHALYLVVDPLVLSASDVLQSVGGVSQSRIASRLARLSADLETVDLSPSLLVARIGERWWGLKAETVRMVARIRHVTSLPGAAEIVWGLTTIGGRVNVILDPARVLGAPPPKLPCWVAEIQTKGAKWAVAVDDEWQVLSKADVEAIDDRTTPPGPPGLASARMRYRDETVYVFSVDALGELARGERREVTR